jgi:hypothetical protein
MLKFPTIWARFPEQTLKELIDATMRLLTAPSPDPHHYSAINFLAIVDPHGVWFQKWMVSNLGRSKVIPEIQKSGLLIVLGDKFVKFAMNVLGSKQDSVHTNFQENDLHGAIIPPCDLFYIEFLYVSGMLARICSSQVGRACFPIPLSEPVRNIEESDAFIKELTLTHFFRLLVKLVSSNYKLCWDDGKTEEVIKLRINNFTGKLIRELIEVWDGILSDEFLQELCSPISIQLKNPDDKQLESNLLVSLEILSAIAAKDSGRKLILRGYQNWNLNVLDCGQNHHLIETIIEAMTFYAKNSPQNNPNLIFAFLFFLRQLYRTCEGFYHLSRFNLSEFICENLLHNDHEWQLSAVDNLLNFGATTKGVELLANSNVVMKCIEYMITRYQKKMQVSKREKFGYGGLVSQFASNETGMRALCESGWLDLSIKELWNSITLDQAHGPQELDIDSLPVKKAMSNICKLLGTFVGHRTSLNYFKNRESELKYLIESLVMAKELSNQNPILCCHYETRFLGLKLLKSLTASIDSKILFDYHYGYLSALIQELQDSFLAVGSIEAEPEFVIDQNSIMVNYLIQDYLAIGGPQERNLPRFEFDNMDSDLLEGHIYNGKVPEKTLISLSETQTPVSDELIPNKLSEIGTWYRTMLADNTHRVSARQLFTKICAIEDFGYEFQDCNYSKIENEPTQVPSEEWQHTFELGSKITQCYASRVIDHFSKDSFQENLNSVLERQKSRYCNSFKTKFNGYDWFTATITILCDANVEETNKFLEFVSQKQHSLYFWSMSRIVLNQTEIKIPATSKLLQWIETLVELELPKVFAGFLVSGCTISQVFNQLT